MDAGLFDGRTLHGRTASRSGAHRSRQSEVCRGQAATVPLCSRKDCTSSRLEGVAQDCAARFHGCGSQTESDTNNTDLNDTDSTSPSRLGPLRRIALDGFTAEYGQPSLYASPQDSP